MRSPYAKRSAVRALSALSICLLPTAARAQAVLQIVDGAGVVLGPVVGVDVVDDPEKARYYFVYDQGGKTVILAARSPDSISLYSGEESYFYYTNSNCSGNPAAADYFGFCCSNPLHLRVIPDGLQQLWEVDTAQQVLPVAESRRRVGYSDSDTNTCESLQPEKILGAPISLWGTLIFTPPIRVERNPFLFGDDFSSANTEAWSNY